MTREADLAAINRDDLQVFFKMAGNSNSSH